MGGETGAEEILVPPAAETPGLNRDHALTPPGACRAQVSPLLSPLCHPNKVLPWVTQSLQHHSTEDANPTMAPSLGQQPGMGTVRVTSVRVTTVR